MMTTPAAKTLMRAAMLRSMTEIEGKPAIERGEMECNQPKRLGKAVAGHVQLRERSQR